MSSIIERLETAADRSGGVTFVGRSTTADGTPARVPWRQLHDEARAVGGALQARGIIPGDHVAILGPTSRELLTIVRGCWLAGVASMVLPLPMRLGSLDEFVAGTRNRIRHGDAALLVIDDQLAAFYEPQPGDPPTISMAALLAAAPSPDALESPAADPERLVILQYTSGSTSEPKGVMIPDRVLRANLDAIHIATRMQPDEVMVSWLPLYHDMGLVGFLALPMCSGVDLVQAAPQDFLAKPGHWMQWVSDFRGTVTAGPNFAWVLATRALRRATDLDLSVLTLALSGAEPVDPAAVEAFVAAAEPFGFAAGSVFPAFGMAEVAIAGAFPPRGRGMRCDVVDRAALEDSRVAKPIDVVDPDEFALTARRLPLLGRAVPGLELRIVDPHSYEPVPDRHVGELLIRGTSVTPGYYKRADATQALFHDGWLCTGDLAYMIGDELVLCGRIKDVIIVGGRNVFPEDIERRVATVAVDGAGAVRAGNVIAVGVDGYKGKESVVVVAEARLDPAADAAVARTTELAETAAGASAIGGRINDRAAALEALRTEIHHRTLEVCGLPARDVVLVQPGTLPKTSSGKLQRAKCRELYLAEELAVLSPEV